MKYRIWYTVVFVVGLAPGSVPTFWMTARAKDRYHNEYVVKFQVAE